MISQVEFNAHDQEIFEAFKERTYPGHSKPISCIAWNPTGSKLVSADNNIRIWNYDDGPGLQRAKDLKCSDATIECIDWFDQNTLYCCGRDAFKTWDIRQGKPAYPHKTEKKSKIDLIRATHCSDGVKYAVSNKENQITIFDRRSNAQLDTIKIPFDLEDFVWDHTDSVLLVAGETGDLLVYESTQGFPLAETLPCHSTKITCLAIDPSDRYLASGAQDALVNLYSLEELLPLSCYHKNQGIISDISFSQQSNFMAVCSDEPYIDIYNVGNGCHSYRFRKESLPVQGQVQWHPKRLILASIDEEDKGKKSQQSNQDDNFVRLWMP